MKIVTSVLFVIVTLGKDLTSYKWGLYIHDMDVVESLSMTGRNT